MSEPTAGPGAVQQPITNKIPAAWQYAVRIFIGCGVAWYVLHLVGISNPLWALVSVIVVTEPEPSAAWMAFLSRIVNTIIGAAIGLPLLYLFGPKFWSVLLGVTISVLSSTQLTRVPGSWRVAPTTAAIVMTPSVLAASRSAGLSTARDRTIEVLLGGAVALVITLCASFIETKISRLHNYRAERRRAA
jgi:uncharacterized membrane protein YccC